MDTGIKYVDMFNRVKQEMSDSTKAATMDWAFMVSNAKKVCDLFEAAVLEVLDNQVQAKCCTAMLFRKLYADIGEYKDVVGFNQFIDLALNRCEPDETIHIPESDVDKLEILSRFLSTVK